MAKASTFFIRGFGVSSSRTSTMAAANPRCGRHPIAKPKDIPARAAHPPDREVRSLTSRSGGWAALAGISFGLAIGCRPHLGLAAAIVLVLLLLTPDPRSKGLRRFFRRDVLAFAIPVTLLGLAVAGYNYARFDNPLEFVTRYLLGGDSYRNFHL